GSIAKIVLKKLPALAFPCANVMGGGWKVGSVYPGSGSKPPPPPKRDLRSMVDVLGLGARPVRSRPALPVAALSGPRTYSSLIYPILNPPRSTPVFPNRVLISPPSLRGAQAKLATGAKLL